MNRKEAAKKLGLKQKHLAKLFNITPSYLSKIDELSEHYENIVSGELAKIELMLFITEIDRLENQVSDHLKTIKHIQRALDS